MKKLFQNILFLALTLVALYAMLLVVQQMTAMSVQAQTTIQGRQPETTDWSALLEALLARDDEPVTIRTEPVNVEPVEVTRIVEVTRQFHHGGVGVRSWPGFASRRGVRKEVHTEEM